MPPNLHVRPRGTEAALRRVHDGEGRLRMHAPAEEEPDPPGPVVRQMDLEGARFLGSKAQHLFKRFLQRFFVDSIILPNVVQDLAKNIVSHLGCFGTDFWEFSIFCHMFLRLQNG